MKFAFPNKRIDDTSWFLSDDNRLIYGRVVLITMAISKDECKIWYTFNDDEEGQYVVEEAQVVANDFVIPTPKYKIGDEVMYQIQLAKSKKPAEQPGVISDIQIHMYESSTFTIHYYMEDEDSYSVNENEIIAFDPRNMFLEEDEFEGGQIIDVSTGNQRVSEADVMGVGV